MIQSLREDLCRHGLCQGLATFGMWPVRTNDKGDYFPVWGTCLGHQELTYLTSGKNLLVKPKTENISLPLNFTTAAKDSRMFQNFPDDLLQKLATEPLTAHFHKWSVSIKNFRKNEKVTNFCKVLTTNTDGKIEFASTMEGVLSLWVLRSWSTQGKKSLEEPAPFSQ
ncbi:unnamed protein product [Natator depressus]